jgi:hypothetical protein
VIQRVLSFDDSPPLSDPLKFFLAVPLFGLAAALGLSWYGEAALVSRWSMPTLALVHLLTLGYLTMAMCGALFQILPVVAGIVIRGGSLTPWWVFILLAAGASLLSAAFVVASPILFRVAGVALGLALFWFLAAAGSGLMRAVPPGALATIAAVRLALASLAMTVVLGLALASSFGRLFSLPLFLLTDLHVGWGLLGWVGMLIFGVAFQVLPMFQATPAYPALMTRRMSLGVASVLGLWCAALLMPQSRGLIAEASIGSALALIPAAFAIATLHVLNRRKRAPDATTLFWRLAALSLLACCVLWIVPRTDGETVRPLLLGILFIVGFGCTAVNGMLYKIVPFLLWYQLQESSGANRKAVPNIRVLLPDQAGRAQFWAHLAALCLLTGAALLPAVLARPAAISFGLSSAWLGINLLRAALLYRRTAAGFALSA